MTTFSALLSTYACTDYQQTVEEKNDPIIAKLLYGPKECKSGALYILTACQKCDELRGIKCSLATLRN